MNFFIWLLTWRHDFGPRAAMVHALIDAEVSANTPDEVRAAAAAAGLHRGHLNALEQAIAEWNAL